MLEALLAVAGGAVQLAALAVLPHGNGATEATGALLAYLGMQALAAALLAMPLQRLLSRHVRMPSRVASRVASRTTSAYLFVAGALVPLGGLLVVLPGMALARLGHRTPAIGGMASVALPEFAGAMGACVPDRPENRPANRPANRPDAGDDRDRAAPVRCCARCSRTASRTSGCWLTACSTPPSSG
ncbi:hypothetical protein K7G19_04265 [Cupriavidus sp. DB3]|uniref:hypothetical protein n=1 Tax=Cupriavidus sp. DB3 TaxID=2873259 RepID=UPI001CF45E28|nr:hypothetical protein [Cupriavidus sp. DB3]MCA7082817.1 hypothetical protein [Cupriavidus sp. DB3]